MIIPIIKETGMYCLPMRVFIEGVIGGKLTYDERA